jgi:hypothetical protein
MRRVLDTLDHAAHDAAYDDPRRQPDRPEEQADKRTGQGAHGRVPADGVAQVVDVDVVAQDGPAHRDPVAAVALDEGDLVQPRLVAGAIAGIRERVLGTRDAVEDENGEIELHKPSL